MFFIFLIIALLCYWGGNFYINRRTREMTSSAPRIVRTGVSLFFITSGLMPFVPFALRCIDIPASTYGNIFNIFGVWMVFVLYMSLILLILDIIKRFICPKLKYGIIYAFVITAALLVTGYYNHLHPQINRIDIATDKHIAGDTVKVVAVSDFHLGYGTGKERLKELVAIINSENPDIILVAGDLIDNNIAPLYEERMHEELNLLRAPMGIYMVPGNHEYIGGMGKCRSFLENTGIVLLADTVVVLGNGVQLLCRDDAFNRERLSVEELVSGTVKEGFTILIDHQPYGIAKKDSLGIDLQISGHTHNGQVWPGSVIIDRLFEQGSGYRKWKNSHVYVSSGISLWGPPLRIGTRGDIAVFRIYYNTK